MKCKKNLLKFLMYYILYRRHGSLRKELNVKTPFNAIEKWFEIKPEIFLQKPDEFKNKVLSLLLLTQVIINNLVKLDSNSVLEHIQGINPVLKEAYRLLDDDGVFYCTVPTNYFDKYSLMFQFLTFLKLRQLSEKYRRFFNKFWKHYHYYDMDGWNKLFEDNGFIVVKSHGYCPKRSVC